LKKDYQHLFPLYEFPEVRFVDFDNIREYKRKYIELRREVDKRLNKRLEYQSMENHFNSSVLLKWKCYHYSTVLLWMFVLVLLFSISITSTLFSIYLDHILPGTKYNWLIVYAPIGFILMPLCFIISILICLCTGWVPTVSNLFQKFYKKTDRSKKGKLDAIYEHFLLSKNRSVSEIQSQLMTISRLLPFQFLWFPVLILMIGIKELFFHHSLWIYFLIPVYMFMVLSIIDAPIQLYQLKPLQSIQSSHSIAWIIATLDIIMMYLCVAVSLGLFAAKVDRILSTNITWTFVLSPFYFFLFLIWISSSLGFVYLTVLSGSDLFTSNERDNTTKCVIFCLPVLIMSLMIIPVLICMILLARKLDHITSNTMKFYWIFRYVLLLKFVPENIYTYILYSPISIGFAVNALLLLSLSTSVWMCNRNRCSFK
jgi:hypothetical protein